MSSVDKNRDWSDIVGRALRNAEVPVDDTLWGRVEESLDRSVVPSQRGRVWQLVAGVAAAVVVALLFLLPEESAMIDSIDDVQPIARIEEIPMPIESVEQEVIEVAEVAEKAVRVASEQVVIYEEEEVVEQEKVKEEVAKAEKSEKATDDYQEESRYSRYYQEVEIPKVKRRTNLTVLYSGGLSSSATSGAALSSYTVIHSALPTELYFCSKVGFDDQYRSSDISHHQPFGVGLRVQRELTQRVIIGSGLNYTRLVSDVNMSGDKIKQNIHFVGLPLILKYRFVTANHFSLYAGVGGTVEYCVGAKVGSQTINERDWHYSADLNIGAEYSINEWLGLYFEPGCSHYFTKTSLQSIRNDSPTTFTIRLGLSFTL